MMYGKHFTGWNRVFSALTDFVALPDTQHGPPTTSRPDGESANQYPGVFTTLCSGSMRHADMLVRLSSLSYIARPTHVSTTSSRKNMLGPASGKHSVYCPVWTRPLTLQSNLVDSAAPDARARKIGEEHSADADISICTRRPSMSCVIRAMEDLTAL